MAETETQKGPAAAATSAEAGALGVGPVRAASWGRVGRMAMRALALAALLALIYVGAEALGLTERLDLEGVRALLQRAGIWGVGVFLGLFALGELLQVPGLVFVGAALAVYPGLRGALIAGAGTLLVQSLNFWLIRGVGGAPFGRQATMTRNANWWHRTLGRLEAHPVRTVVLLRLVLILTPALNYALALSGIRFRDYLIGTALGLAIPLLIVIGFGQVALWA